MSLPRLRSVGSPSSSFPSVDPARGRVSGSHSHACVRVCQSNGHATRKRPFPGPPNRHPALRCAALHAAVSARHTRATEWSRRGMEMETGGQWSIPPACVPPATVQAGRSVTGPSGAAPCWSAVRARWQLPLPHTEEAHAIPPCQSFPDFLCARDSQPLGRAGGSCCLDSTICTRVDRCRCRARPTCAH